jgi:hypothetical protein
VVDLRLPKCGPAGPGLSLDALHAYHQWGEHFGRHSSAPENRGEVADRHRRIPREVVEVYEKN